MPGWTPKNATRNPAAASILSTLLLVAAFPALTAEIEERQWIVAQSDYFRIYSTLREKKTIEFLRHLDLLRLTVPIITNVQRTDSSVPTEIYALKRARDFDKFNLDRNYVGVFVPGLRNNTILLRESPRADEISVILHEYAHYLMRNHAGYEYPRWYNEGFAEYLSSVRLSDKHFEVGYPPEDRVYGLERIQWISVDKVLDPDEYESLSDQGRSMFYGQAWALVHFLLNREYEDGGFPGAMQRYVDLTSSGTQAVAAFEDAFGLRTGVLWRDTKRYLKKCCQVFRLNLEVLQPSFQPVVRQMSTPEISLHLGRVARRFGNNESAERWLAIAQADEATKAEAEAAIGDILKFAGDFERAQPHFDLAVELAPDDPYVQLDAAEFWMQRAEKTPLPSERDTYVRRAKSHFVAAWKLDNTIPETYAMYGRLHLLDGDAGETAVEMLEEAAGLHPSNAQIRTLLIQAYVEAGHDDDALRTARLILHWGHDDNETARYARSIIEWIANKKPAASGATNRPIP